MSVGGLHVLPVTGLPEIVAGDDLAAIIIDALTPLSPAPGDIVAVAQKVVSKAEGRIVALASVIPSDQANDIAGAAHKDARQVELVLQESREVLRVKPGVIVVEDVRGHVMANAGIDRSNVPGDERVLLLPVDPDASAHALRTALGRRFGKGIGVIVTDSFGRAWRRGVVGVAIGAAGVTTLNDARGRADRHGRALEVTEVAEVDALAAAAALVMGEADEGVPCVLIRGWRTDPDKVGLGGLLRPKAEDMFR